MRSQFRTYQLAVTFHHSVRGVALPGYLKDQMLRASSSIALNLAEGSSKPTRRDQVKFYHISLASLRECQAGLDLAPRPYPELVQAADQLGAHLYRLCYSQMGGGGGSIRAS
jgi:four helix bundle protein